MRDGFVVDVSEGERSLRHLFLYTDLLLCNRNKPATKGWVQRGTGSTFRAAASKHTACTPPRKQEQYRFCWFLPLGGLKLRWGADQERSPDAHLRIHTARTKMHLLRQQLRHYAVCVCVKNAEREFVHGCFLWVKYENVFFVKNGSRAMALAARSRKKLEQMELMLLTHSPVYTLELHSPSGKVHTHTPCPCQQSLTFEYWLTTKKTTICFTLFQSHTLLLSSLFELEEWREVIDKLTKDSKFTAVDPSGGRESNVLALLDYCRPTHLPLRPHIHHVQYGSLLHTLRRTSGFGQITVGK